MNAPITSNKFLKYGGRKMEEITTVQIDQTEIENFFRVRRTNLYNFEKLMNQNRQYVIFEV